MHAEKCPKTIKVEISISKAQREYMRGIRQWLSESSQDKSVVVGGPLPCRISR